MCEFVSWIEKDKKIYFLTGNQIFNTLKGKALQAFCASKDDHVGHGAIRHYYRLAKYDGIQRECTDFSTPNNFPDEIVVAIKEGKMRGLGVQPSELLTAPVYKLYQETTENIFWDIFAIPENRNPLWR